MMEWVLQVANDGVLPAMALYQVLHLSQDPLSAVTSHSSGISTRNRCSPSPPSSKDRASSQGSAQPDVPEGNILEKPHPLLESGLDRLSSEKPPTPLHPSRSTEEDILATASLTVAEVIAKLKGVMARDVDRKEAKLSFIVEELCDSAMDKVMDELVLHHHGSTLSEFYSTSISEDLILNTWQDAREKIQVLADIHTDAVDERMPPRPLLSANTNTSEAVFHREKKEAEKMVLFFIGSASEAEEMEKAMGSPRPSCVTAASTGSGRSSASSIGRVRCDSEPHSPSTQTESLSGILAHHALFQRPGVFTTEEKLELVRVVGGILQGTVARKRRSSLNQPEDADTASLPQNISGACNIIHLVLENFSAAAQMITEGEVAFLQPRGNDFTLLVECVSESLLSQVTEEVKALQRRSQGVSSGRSSRRSRSQGELPGNWVKGKEEEACTFSCQESFLFSTQQEERRPEEECSSPKSPSPRGPSPRSKANSHNLNLTAHKMLDTVVRMAYSASRSVSNDEDCENDQVGSSAGLLDQAEYDLGRLLASRNMCTRMLQARIQNFSMELIDRLYELLLDTQVGRFPSTRRCRSKPNVQNPEVKQHLDWELFTPILYNFIHLAFKKLMENFLGLTNSLPDECVLVNDHLEWMCKKDRTSIRDVSWESRDSDDSSDSSDCTSLEGSYCVMLGPSPGTVGRNRPSSSVSQDQRRALEAISEVLTLQVGGVLQRSCNDPEKVMAIVNKGLDAEVTARIANFCCSSSEATTGSLDPELSSGFINLEVGQSEKDSLTKGIKFASQINPKGDWKDDAASCLPELVQVLPWLPPRPPETPSLQTLEIRVQEKVWKPSKPSALHHLTLRDLLHGLLVRLALQESPSTSSAPTFSQLEATLLQEVGWILRTQDGISLVLEHLPQSPCYSGTDALDAMLEAAYAKLSLSANSSRALLRSARHGEAGAICCLAQTIATVISRHAEDWRAPAVSDSSVHFEKENATNSAGLVKAGESSSSLCEDVRLHDMESSGLGKASETHMEIQADERVKKRCDRFGLVKARECPLSSRSPEALRISRKQRERAVAPGLLKAWEKIDRSSEETSTSQSCHSSSSSSHSISSPSVPSQTFNNRSSIFNSKLGRLGKKKLSSLRRWFTSVS
ncbi:uncharacterized protein LOC124484891 [Hypomesus transpacificus]|uniref:uncharacterized protein LOC124484891 n=1 Tax=Hypomesus transpacificus TaxID=137520 RepID=UPI001F07C2D5|nr:uncharacterized protein LOC124484891 [Hypomesus transpacificus]